MTILLEKLQALAETEKKATAGPWLSCEHKDYPGFQVISTPGWELSIPVVATDLDSKDYQERIASFALIADSRTLLPLLLESWFAQHDSLEKIKRCTPTGDCARTIAEAALNLATTPHP